jgi:hypothetical protein
MIIVNDGVGHIFSCKVSAIQFHRETGLWTSGPWRESYAATFLE